MFMTEKIYKDFYEQDFSILKKVIGMDLKSLHFNKGSISLGTEQILNGNGSLGMTFHDREKAKLKFISFAPRGSDSIGGDIYGFEFSQENESYSGQVLYPEHFKLEGLTFYGEEKEEETTDSEAINWFYSNVEQKPEKVIVKKKTIGKKIMCERFLLLKLEKSQETLLLPLHLKFIIT